MLFRVVVQTDIETIETIEATDLVAACIVIVKRYAGTAAVVEVMGLLTHSRARVQFHFSKE